LEPFNISATVEARNFKFGTEMDRSEFACKGHSTEKTQDLAT